MVKNSRQIALQWLLQVIDGGRSVNEILSEKTEPISLQQKALAKQLLFGCLRFYFQLNTVANHLLD